MDGCGSGRRPAHVSLSPNQSLLRPTATSSPKHHSPRPSFLLLETLVRCYLRKKKLKDVDWEETVSRWRQWQSFFCAAFVYVERAEVGELKELLFGAVPGELLWCPCERLGVNMLARACGGGALVLFAVFRAQGHALVQNPCPYALPCRCLSSHHRPTLRK